MQASIAHGGRNLALTGVPRSGTTLCCHLLGLAPDTVALLEPMEVHRLPVGDRSAAVDTVSAFFAESRRSLLDDGTAWSEQHDGRVPDNPFASQRDGQGRRARAVSRGRIRVERPLTPSFTLAIKHPAAFTALLPELAARFDTVALVRNPLAALASWHSLDLPIARGRMPAAERLDPALGRRLTGIMDVVSRQLAILDWMFERYRRHLPPRALLRYEDMVATGGQALAMASGVPVPRVPLTERNASRLYDIALCERLASRLLADRGSWRGCYGDVDIDMLLKRMRAGHE